MMYNMMATVAKSNPNFFVYYYKQYYNVVWTDVVFYFNNMYEQTCTF